MKAKVKDTGEIVEVKFNTHPNPAIDETYWWCKDNQTAFAVKALAPALLVGECRGESRLALGNEKVYLTAQRGRSFCSESFTSL